MPGAPLTVSGRKVTGAMLAVIVFVVSTFIGLTIWKLDAIRTSVAVRSSAEPIIRHPAGDLVVVPKGEFQAGADRHQASLPSFYIDKTEVTNAAFAAFAKGNGTARPELPVVNVTLSEAEAFCAAAGKRLPTALEWEKAARGSDGRLYPWGSNADPDNAVTDGKPLAPANSMQKAGSPYGVLHLAGNAGEWVQSSAAKGGSFDRPLAQAAAYESVPHPAGFAAPNLGFRCAKDAPPKP